jgi:cell division protein FtsB
MMAKRIVVSVWAGFLVYSLLMLAAGPSGPERTAALLKDKAKLLANIAQLRALNGKLAGRLEGLKTDRDAVALEARELGYLGGDETLVMLPGARQTSKFSDAGSVIGYKEKPWDWGGYFAALAVLAACACWISLGFGGRNSADGGKKGRSPLRK